MTLEIHKSLRHLIWRTPTSVVPWRVRRDAVLLTLANLRRALLTPSVVVDGAGSPAGGDGTVAEWSFAEVDGDGSFEESRGALAALTIGIVQDVINGEHSLLDPPVLMHDYIGADNGSNGSNATAGGIGGTDGGGAGAGAGGSAASGDGASSRQAVEDLARTPILEIFRAAGALDSLSATAPLAALGRHLDEVGRCADVDRSDREIMPLFATNNAAESKRSVVATADAELQKVLAVLSGRDTQRRRSATDSATAEYRYSYAHTLIITRKDKIKTF